MSTLLLKGLSANSISDANALTSSSADVNFPLTKLGLGKPWRMFRFGAAALDDWVHANFLANITPTFCAIDFHNIDAGVTAIELRRGAAGAVLVATLTRNDPSFFKIFTGVADTDWRLKFVGTNAGSAIMLGEWILGAYKTIDREHQWGWKVSYDMPQVAIDAEPINRQPFARRTIELDYMAETQNEMDEIKSIHEELTHWGEEPLVIADTIRNIVIHGRVLAGWEETYEENWYKYRMVVKEDPFPVLTK